MKFSDLTKAQERALEIVKEKGPIRPREFAQAMWPDSPAWDHHTRCGPNGVHKGGGMYLAGGGYLGKLAKKGWVAKTYAYWGKDEYRSKGYYLTHIGYAALKGIDLTEGNENETDYPTS